MRFGTVVLIFLICLTLTERGCAASREFPSDKYGMRPQIAAWWCGDAKCLDPK